jgi:hypothetical protein
VDFVIGGPESACPARLDERQGGAPYPAWAKWGPPLLGAQTHRGCLRHPGNSASKHDVRGPECLRDAHLVRPPLQPADADGNYYFGRTTTSLSTAAPPPGELDSRSSTTTRARSGASSTATQEILLTRGESIDFYSGITLCGNGCNNNAVSAGMTQVVKGKGGSAEADVTLVLTYPQ